MSSDARSRRDTRLAVLGAAVLAAFAVGRPLVDPGRVLLAPDTVAQHLPWSAVVPHSDEARPRNPYLSDQGLCFYPFYRWVGASWRRGDAPLWNPLIGTGVPGLANPQTGALDPQVALPAAIEGLAGRDGFHWGLALGAFLRVAGALLGAYLLARELGLGAAAAALAAASFGGSGFLVLWRDSALGHVAPLLPWIVLGLERTRGPRPLLAAAGTALALALAILGGHPETSFYVGAASGAWALGMLRRDRRAGGLGLAALALGTLAGSALLLPFVEYLQLSSARRIRTEAVVAGGFDVLSLGLLALLVFLGIAWRGSPGAAPGAREPTPNRTDTLGNPPDEPGAPGGAPAAILGLGFAIAGGVLLLGARGLGRSAALALTHDLWGAPGQAGGFRGGGIYLEQASGWLPLVTIALAIAGLLAGPSGGLRGRRMAAVLGLIAWLACLRTPGVVDLFRSLPLIGLGATERMAPVAALMLGLLAGDALERAGRAPRRAAALALAILLGLTLVPSGARPPASTAGPEQDELVHFLASPPPAMESGPIPLAGWIHPGLPAATARVHLERVDERGAALSGTALEVPCELLAEPDVPVPPDAAPPEGARYFRAHVLDAGRLGEGAWRVSVRFFARSSPGAPPEPPDLLGARVAGTVLVERPARWSLPSAALAVLALAVAFAARAGAGRMAWAAAALAVLHGLWFARGMNPSVPLAEVFPETATERIVARELGPYRFFADTGVFPPNSGMVRSLRGLASYDAMDVAAYDDFRRLALVPGGHALLGWNPRGVALDSQAFRLLGVGVLALSAPLAHPDWELVAGPSRAAPELAEAYVYRARAPLPRAFCAAEIATVAELGERLRADPGSWDPLRTATVEGAWRPAQPFAEARVGVPEFRGNNEVRVQAALDGDGLLVLTEQWFPGWTAEVDGRPAEILVTDAVFRGVPLGPGEHEVVFRFRPGSVRLGAAISAAAWIAIAALAALGALRRRR